MNSVTLNNTNTILDRVRSEAYGGLMNSVTLNNTIFNSDNFAIPSTSKENKFKDFGFAPHSPRPVQRSRHERHRNSLFHSESPTGSFSLRQASRSGTPASHAWTPNLTPLAAVSSSLALKPVSDIEVVEDDIKDHIVTGEQAQITPRRSSRDGQQLIFSLKTEQSSHHLSDLDPQNAHTIHRPPLCTDGTASTRKPSLNADFASDQHASSPRVRLGPSIVDFPHAKVSVSYMSAERLILNSLSNDFALCM